MASKPSTDTAQTTAQAGATDQNGVTTQESATGNKAASKKVPGYIVRSFETSFRRIGRRFTREPTFVAKADLTAAQIKTLLAEKKLIVQEVDDQPAN